MGNASTGGCNDGCFSMFGSRRRRGRSRRRDRDAARGIVGDLHGGAFDYSESSDDEQDGCCSGNRRTRRRDRFCDGFCSNEKGRCGNCCGDYMADFCAPKFKKMDVDRNQCCGIDCGDENDCCRKKKKRSEDDEKECCQGDRNDGDCCSAKKKDRFKNSGPGGTSGSEKSLLRITVGYWKFRGLGAPMRMMCVYSGVSYDEEQFEVRRKEGSGWKCPEYDERRKELYRKNPFSQLPFVQNHTTGEVVAGINAVYLYLGRILKLDGRSHSARLKNESLLFYMLGTVWLEYGDFVYPFKKNDSEASFHAGLTGYLNKSIPAHYDKLEKWLRIHRDPFFAGEELCTCDFHVWEFLDVHEALAKKNHFKSPMNGYDLLDEFYENFSNTRKLNRYWDSKNFKLPMNNKMAFF